MRDGALWPIYSGAMGSVCVLTQYNYCGDHSYCDCWGALGDKDNSNQRLHKACTGGPLHVQTSVVHRTWHHCCCGCHLDALGIQRWWQSKLIWFVTYPVSSIIASCDWQRGQPDSALQLLVLYAHDDVSIYLIYTLWKRIESFNEYYRIFVLNVVVTILRS